MRQPTLLKVAPVLFEDRQALFDFIRDFDLRAKDHDGVTWLQLDDEGFALLGLKRTVHKTLIRLWEAGEIKLARMSPQVYMLDLGSWRDHLRRTAEDPFYWDDEARQTRWRRACGNVRWPYGRRPE